MKKQSKSPIKENQENSSILNIKIFNSENFNEVDEKQKDPPKVKKEMLDKDTFSKFNKKNMENNEHEQFQRNERMRNYSKTLINLKV